MPPPIEFNLKDDEGRPLFERRAPVELRAGVEFQLKQCPYRGSRFHHSLLMNMSGLKQVSRHWSAVIGLVSAVREEFIRRNECNVLTGTDLLQVAFIVNSVPGYRCEGRPRLPRDACVAAPLSAAYKVSVGIVTLLLRLCARGWMDGEEGQQGVSVDTLDEFAERGHLIGSVGVCPAPPEMIREIIDVFVNGRKVLPSSAEVREIVRHYDELAGYALRRLAVRLVQDVTDVERRAVVEGALRLRGADDHSLFTRLKRWYHDEPTFQAVHNPYLLHATVNEACRSNYLRGVSRLIRRLEPNGVRWAHDDLFSGDSRRVPPSHLAAAAALMRGLPAMDLDDAGARHFQTILARQMQLLQLAAGAYAALGMAGARPEDLLESGDATGDVAGDVADFRSYATLLDFVVVELRGSLQHQ